MYTKQELEKLTVLELRKVAKENRVKLGAGIDKAGIVEKILNGQQEPLPKPPLRPAEDKTESFLSFDVTSAPKSPFYSKKAEEESQNPAVSLGWQKRQNGKPGFRAGQTAPVKRFGPQSRIPVSTQIEEDGREVPSAAGIEIKPKENLVTSDGYRLGYRAQSSRNGYQTREDDYRGGQSSGYRPKYPYQQRNVIPPAAENHFHDNVYIMARNMEFDKQIAEGIQPDVLSYLEGNPYTGILEIQPEGYGFVTAQTGEDTVPVYVSPAQIKRFGLSSGDILEGQANLVKEDDPYASLLYINTVNGKDMLSEDAKLSFENLEAVYPTKRIPLETTEKNNMFVRVMDLVTPIGYGQRAMIITPPESSSIIAMKDIAVAIRKNDPDSVLFVLLIDVPPEEIVLMKKSVKAEVFASSFGDSPEAQTRTTEMALERAQRLAIEGKNAVILLSSLNKLVRAYQNQVYQGNKPITNTVTPSALIRPKRFYSMAKNTEEAGTLTIVATLETETGSRIDDIIYEEFKGTANLTLTLCSPGPDDAIKPMIDLQRSSTRHEENLMTEQQIEGVKTIRSMLLGESNENAVAQIVDMMRKTKSNDDMFSKLKGWMAILDSSKR